MNGQTVLFLCWCVVMLTMFYLAYTRGKKAIAIFPDIETVLVKYRDRSASGHSTRTLMTRLGGTSRGLDIVVTDSELWLKCPLLFASFLQQYEMLHRVPLKNIVNVERVKETVAIEFTSEAGSLTKVVLTTKRPDELVAALAKTDA